MQTWKFGVALATSSVVVEAALAQLTVVQATPRVEIGGSIQEPAGGEFNLAVDPSDDSVFTLTGDGQYNIPRPTSANRSAFASSAAV